jgi:hypothetical protein
MSLVQTLGSAVNGGAEAYFVSLAGAFARAGIEQAAAIRAHAAREAALANLGVPTRVLRRTVSARSRASTMHASSSPG